MADSLDHIASYEALKRQRLSALAHPFSKATSLDDGAADSLDGLSSYEALRRKRAAAATTETKRDDADDALDYLATQEALRSAQSVDAAAAAATTTAAAVATGGSQKSASKSGSRKWSFCCSCEGPKKKNSAKAKPSSFSSSSSSSSSSSGGIYDLPELQSFGALSEQEALEVLRQCLVKAWPRSASVQSVSISGTVLPFKECAGEGTGAAQIRELDSPPSEVPEAVPDEFLLQCLRVRGGRPVAA